MYCCKTTRIVPARITRAEGDGTLYLPPQLAYVNTLNNESIEMIAIKVGTKVGRGSGQVVSVLAFHSDDLSLNPTGAYSFFPVKFVFEKN